MLVLRRFAMDTKVTASVWDGRPSFELDYKPYKHLLGRSQVSPWDRGSRREDEEGLRLLSNVWNHLLSDEG